VKIPEILNQNFVKCFLKDWKNLTDEEGDMLGERAQIISKQFTFTKKRLIKLQRLSDMLKAEEIRIKPHAERIYSLQDSYVAEKIIDDYEVEIIIECWNNNYYRKLNEAFYGNPFFRSTTLSTFHKNQDIMFYEDNWNEFQFMDGHPLKDQFHCYTFHHLYDHTVLTWFDILNIDSVWIELRVWNQFFSELKK
jgi:hypothetical protein